MKKVLLSLLVILSFMSCSKDENSIQPINGQYVARSGDIVVGLVLDNGRCVDFDLYVRGKRYGHNKPAAIYTKGEYPEYTYYINDLSVAVHFSDASNLTAILYGELRYEKEDNGLLSVDVLVFENNAPIAFVLNNIPLDADNNGILDNNQ